MGMVLGFHAMNREGVSCSSNNQFKAMCSSSSSRVPSLGIQVITGSFFGYVLLPFLVSSSSSSSS